MIQETIDRFMAAAPILLPDIVNPEYLFESEYSDDQAVLSFQLPYRLTLEDTMNMFEEQMAINILYHSIPSENTDFGRCCCAYSNPLFEHMFKINAAVGTDGLVSLVAFTLYESLECMGVELLADYDSHNTVENKGFFQNRIKVLQEFL